MNDQEVAIHAGKVQAIANMCIALVVAHPEPAGVQRIFERICRQTIERSATNLMPREYKLGVESIVRLLSEATGVAVAVDLLSAVPPSGGH